MVTATKARPKTRTQYVARKALTVGGVRYAAGEVVDLAWVPAATVKMLLDQKRILPVEPDGNEGG